MIYPRYIVTRDGDIGHRFWPSENYYRINRTQRGADEWELAHGGKNLPEIMDGYYKAVEQYVLDLFKSCKFYPVAYRDTPVSEIKQDLADYEAEGKGTIPFPHDLVAWTLHKIGNAVPFPEPAPYHMVWDTDNCSDGAEQEDFESAKSAAIDCLCEWQAYFRGDRDDWDYMIETCSAYVAAFDPETEEYEDCWHPSDEELTEIGWVYADELPEEMQKILWPDENKEENT